MARLNFENATPPWQLESPYFGQAKHGQKGPAATFAEKALVPLCLSSISPFMPRPITIYLFLFELQAEEEQNNSVFHEFPLPLAKQNRRPAAVSILIPPTFPIASLNRYTPKFLRVPQKLTLCKQFGLQVLPK